MAKIVREDGPHFHVFANQAAEHFSRFCTSVLRLKHFWLENLAAAEGKKLAGERRGAIGGVINAGGDRRGIHGRWRDRAGACCSRE